MKTLTVDLITYDERNDEYVLYLVEDGPWPLADEDWSSCLKAIQNRILDTVDVAVDGHLAKQQPDSKGRKIRIQIDSPHGCPRPLQETTEAIEQYLKDNDSYRKAICESAYISGLRIVTGAQMERFTGERTP